MVTIISDDFISNIHNINSYFLPAKNSILPNETYFNNYLKNGSYILTIRANNLYIVKRNLFYLIPSLGTMYGLFRSPNEDAYWFNSKNQFRSVCYYSNLDIFDYSTTFEEQSLYEYKEENYFDKDFNLINPIMLYCVVRH